MQSFNIINMSIFLTPNEYRYNNDNSYNTSVAIKKVGILSIVPVINLNQQATQGQNIFDISG